MAPLVNGTPWSLGIDYSSDTEILIPGHYRYRHLPATAALVRCGRRGQASPREWYYIVGTRNSPNRFELIRLELT